MPAICKNIIASFWEVGVFVFNRKKMLAQLSGHPIIQILPSIVRLSLCPLFLFVRLDSSMVQLKLRHQSVELYFGGSEYTSTL